jgi:hypothetical protein
LEGDGKGRKETRYEVIGRGNKGEGCGLGKVWGMGKREGYGEREKGEGEWGRVTGSVWV